MIKLKCSACNNPAYVDIIRHINGIGFKEQLFCYNHAQEIHDKTKDAIAANLIPSITYVSVESYPMFANYIDDNAAMRDL